MRKIGREKEWNSLGAEEDQIYYYLAFTKYQRKLRISTKNQNRGPVHHSNTCKPVFGWRVPHCPSNDQEVLIAPSVTQDLFPMPCKKKLLEVIFEVTGLISVTYHFISFSNQQSATLQEPDIISIYAGFISKWWQPLLHSTSQARKELGRPHSNSPLGKALECYAQRLWHYFWCLTKEWGNCMQRHNSAKIFSGFFSWYFQINYKWFELSPESLGGINIRKSVLYC